MKKSNYLLLIALVACCFISCQKPDTSIRVMSYNIRLGIADDGSNSWEYRKAATPAMLDTIQPDMFGVQEAYGFQIDYILSSCPRYACVGVGREDGISEGEHMSIFYDSTRYELMRWGTYWLSETPNVPSRGWDAMCKRTATWTLLQNKTSGQKLYYVNTHLDHIGWEARKNGLSLIYDSISVMNPEGWPMILTGDFNILPDNEGLTEIEGLMSSARFTAIDRDTIGSFNGFGKTGYSDAAPLLEENQKNILWPLDYIYYSGAQQCLRFKVDTTTYENIPYISDHYPVYADITLR